MGTMTSCCLTFLSWQIAAKPKSYTLSLTRGNILASLCCSTI
jgi:hypothetical protein